jgi:enterochelin esterase-like enzyme
MKKLFLSAAILFLLIINTSAQQALWGGPNLISPEIKPDNTVTFRFLAPDAADVKISGDWMPSQGMTPGSVAMTKGEKGVWSYTTDKLSSELYGYFFLVNGLKCTDPNNVFTNRDVATVTNFFIIGNGKADNYIVRNVPHGSVTRRWYNSPGNNKVRRITIYTPPGYEENKAKYPVLYLLHGAGGDEEAWMALGRTSQILDNLIAQGKAVPMIVVMPNSYISEEAAPGESSTGFSKPSFQMPNTMDGKFEETFPDIINFVEGSYRVKTDKGNRAIAGLSMGGYHSLHISRFYPKTFDYVGLFSAAILPTDKVSSPVYENIDNTLLAQKNNGYKLYWIGIGKTDFLYKNVQDFKAKLDGIKMPYEYRESEGGHTWVNWRTYLSEFVPKLFR